MPKTFTAQNIHSIGGLRIFTDGAGNMTGVEVDAEVNYGTFGRMETIDLFPQLGSSERQQLQNIYKKIKTLLEQEFIG